MAAFQALFDGLLMTMQEAKPVGGESAAPWGGEEKAQGGGFTVGDPFAADAP